MADLDLGEVIEVLSNGEPRREPFVRSVLSTLSTDPEVIAFRAAVVTDMLEDTGLRDRLQRALPGLTGLVQMGRPHPEEWVVYQIVQRLNELALYSEVAVQLQEALEGGEGRAPALRALHAYLHELTHTEAFVALQAELPALRASLAKAGSVTIGINLSDDLQPESATILNIAPDKVAGRSTLLERLLGDGNALHGITPLRAGQPAPSPMHGPENQLVRDLRRLLEQVVTPVRQALDRYLVVNTRTLHALEPELAFLLNGVALIERLRRAHLPVCRPECAPIDERAGHLEDSYNISLALRMLRASGAPATVADRLVRNEIVFDEARGRVWILTGPNRGGKTVFTRSVGLAHVLFQAGLYVPARTARLSPVDAIYTHFPTPERAQPGMGRLDEEAARLGAIFQQAHPQSLILLNEVLAGTSAVEALGLAVDAVRGLRLLGARAVYVTHLHELAARVGEINATSPGDGTVGSLVAEVEAEVSDGNASSRRTYRIRPGAPTGASHASEIAEQHGISFPQLAQLLRKRGILAEEVGGVESR